LVFNEKLSRSIQNKIENEFQLLKEII
jgi:hypothetical protein